MNNTQLDLFETVLDTYDRFGPSDNATLYQSVARRLGLSDDDVEAAVRPVGRCGERHNLFHRRLRWVQQSLRQRGLLERLGDRRGVWRLTNAGQQALHRIDRRLALIAFSTRLGLAVLGDARAVFQQLDEPITLCITSPPYPLARPRAYGGPTREEYLDFICEVLEPVVQRLRPGGSICLNISNDIFERGRPDRSLYRERLVLALHERLGLYKMDEIIWENRSKPPGPTYWASRLGRQLHSAYEPVYWFTNDPQRVLADNRRVLEPHSDRHRRLMAAGGEKRRTHYGDGAYRLREGSFARETPGRIPRNVLSIGHSCPRQRALRRYCGEHGYPFHGAPFPLALAEFLVRFLSEQGDLVVDPMAGWATVAEAAEDAGRRWLVTDLVREFLEAAGWARFSPRGAWVNPQLRADRYPECHTETACGDQGSG